MRKRLIQPATPGSSAPEENWLDIDSLAQVELTSEDPAHPIESALLPGTATGWRAGQPGEQTIRFIFDKPERLKRIWLVFLDAQNERLQEFVLRWSADGGKSFREIVRQQWCFNPSDASREVEDFRVELAGVTHLELTIWPDTSGRPARATLSEIRLA